MTIETVAGGAIVVTGEKDIAFVQLLALKGALKLETVGLKRRGKSALSMVKARFGFKGNAVKVLAQLEAHIATLRPVPAQG